MNNINRCNSVLCRVRYLMQLSSAGCQMEKKRISRPNSQCHILIHLAQFGWALSSRGSLISTKLPSNPSEKEPGVLPLCLLNDKHKFKWLWLFALFGRTLAPALPRPPHASFHSLNETRVMILISCPQSGRNEQWHILNHRLIGHSAGFSPPFSLLTGR